MHKTCFGVDSGEAHHLPLVGCCLAAAHIHPGEHLIEHSGHLLGINDILGPVLNVSEASVHHGLEQDVLDA